MQRRQLLASALLAAAMPVRAQSTSWPARPLRIIVPGGPGGVTDIRARWIGQRLSALLHQPVAVENRPGAGGNIGMEAGARSAPDGYTLVVIHQGTMTVNAHLYARTGYDPLTDFVPITRLGRGPLLLAVHPSVPAQSVRELVELGRSRQGHLSYGSPGVGTPPHLAVELFCSMTGMQAVHVPYRGGGQSASDLVAGHVQFEIENMNVLLPHVVGGRLRPLAVTGSRRVSTLPEVPTVAQSGWPDYEFLGWVGIAVPAGTPPTIVDRLYQHLHAILATQEALEWFGAVGAEPGDDPPEVFARAIRIEHAKWGRVIRETGLKIE
jgi:tripartite-type tricarboxylate transporter receptor subunit TctC